MTDDASLKDVAQRARVVITTVGPYLTYGEPLVAACADAGTDYVDLTGEPEFVDRTYLAHHATAEHTGARLVHACGFDSIPHDLGAYFAVQQLPDDRREALIMRFALDMDNREIARALDRTDGATKVLIHRAIRQLEDIVQADLNGDGQD